MKKKIEKELTAKDLKWHSFEDMVAEFSRNKKFKKTYDEEMLRFKLARQVRELRDTKHFTQKMLARKSGMPQSVIARVESGRRSISLDTLGHIAHAFGKEIELV